MFHGESKDSGETSSSPANLAPAISLPKGGGAIRGIDEKFTVNPATGTASLSVPIFTTPGRQGFSPQLALSYDSGAGNGPFGLGWNLSVPAITRKTDKGLPRYQDAEESDTFILSGAEDLVPALRRNDAQDTWETDTLPHAQYHIQRYRPRIEGLFARIEKWQDKETGEVFLKSVSKDNVTSLYGLTEKSRIADPNEETRVFQWLLEASFDDKGNLIVYEYKQEDAANVDPSLPQERNRLANGKRYANRYLKRIWYGYQRPFEPGTWLEQHLAGGEPFQRDDWLFQVVFDYGEHDEPQPTPEGKTLPWKARLDAFSSFRAGFEIRTQRLCQRVLMYHRFQELGDTPCLVRSTDLKYDESPTVSYLTSVTQTGYVREGDGKPYTQRALPPLEFEYSRAEVDETVHFIDAGSLENLPVGLDGVQYQWVELDGEGISGVLTEQGPGWFYKRNLGSFRFDPTQLAAEGLPGPPTLQEPGPPRFAPARVVASQPSLANLRGGQQQIMDLAGDGQKDLVLLGDALTGFYERDDGYWASFRPFQLRPDVNWSDPNLRPGPTSSPAASSRDDMRSDFPKAWPACNSTRRNANAQRQALSMVG